MLPRVGNDLHVEVPIVDARDRQADAVDRDRSLAHDVRRESRRKLDGQPERVAVAVGSPRSRRSRRRAPARSARRAARRRAAAARDSRAPRASARRAWSRARSPARCRRGRRRIVRRDNRQADAVDREAVARLQLAAAMRRRQPQAKAGRRRLHLGDLPDRFNQSGEHTPRSAVSAPSRRVGHRRQSERLTEATATPPGPSVAGRPEHLDAIDEPGVPERAMQRARRPRRSSTRRRGRPATRAAVASAPLPARSGRRRPPRPGLGQAVGAASTAEGVLTIMTGPASSVENSARRAASAGASRRRPVSAAACGTRRAPSATDRRRARVPEPTRSRRLRRARGG